MPESRPTASKLLVGLCVLVVCLAVGLAYFILPGRFHRAAVRRAIPKILAELGRQQKVLEGAVESYHKQFGYFPPSTPQSRGVTNALYYELAGTRYDPGREHFFDFSQKEPISRDQLRSCFGMDSLSNALPIPTWP